MLNLRLARVLRACALTVLAAASVEARSDVPGITGPVVASVWNVFFTPQLVATPCSPTAQQINFSGQNFIPDPSGAFSTIWSPVTPVMQVNGQLNATQVTATLTCSTGQPGSGSISATWTGTRYVGTFTFPGSSGQAVIAGWSTRAPLPSPRFASGAAAVNRIVYVVGGLHSTSFINRVDAYDSLADTWSMVAPLPTVREGPGVAALGGLIYAVGGNTPGSVPSNVVEAYNPSTNTWSTRASMPTARAHLALVAAGGRLYAIGGEASGVSLGVVERYDPGANAWTTKASMPTARSFLAAGALNSDAVIAAVGGAGSVNELYNVASNSWATGAPMPTGRSGVAAGVAGNILYVMGGGGDPPLRANEAYVPSDGVHPDSWFAAPLLPTGRGELAIGVIDDVLYAVGGETGSGAPPPDVSTVEAFSTGAAGANVVPPTVVTGAAGGIGLTGATLNGTANPNGTATTANFEYGLSTGYGNTTPAQALGSGNVAVAIGGGSITGLACGTLYHFRASATNTGGTSTGSDATFTTSACPPPTVATGSATAIGIMGATLNGTANPNGSATTADFEYGLTTGYGTTTPGQSLGSGNAIVSIGGGTITGLACNSLYHFRAVATNVGGTTNGSDATFTTVACSKGDFNGDGKSDVLWRNSANGQNIGWLMNGLTVGVSGFLPTIADTNWEVKGVGDFDADGKADVIWRNKVTGQDIGWLMNGLTVANAAFLPTIADTNWDIVGVGDFNGDGKADVILRNKVSGQNIGWLMNGLTVANAAFLPTIADTNWEIVGIGDLNGDGKADVLWRNKVSGQDIGWLMNGLTVVNSAFLPTIADTNWKIVGVGDVNGDGKADVLLRNSANGQDIGWLMDGLTVVNAAFLPAIADTNWEMKAFGDVDGDGKSDVQWRNKVSGQNIVWLMNGLTVANSAFLPTIADTNWQIVGPR